MIQLDQLKSSIHKTHRPAKRPEFRTPITVAYGDGVGPEIMRATLKILEAAQAPLSYTTIQIGEKAYTNGSSSGIPEGAWDQIRQTQILLKGPITTPSGKGYKSLNVTMRKALGLYANVRPCVAYHPFVQTKHPTMDLVIIRENEEDLYAGIEHRQTDEVYQCLKLITRPGCEKIVRYAFEYARKHGRRKVTCFSKDNIMKMTDGLFHRVFDEIGAHYPEIEQQHMIVDIGAARLANRPELFDVVVMPNLYGDILSDVAAEIAGSVGLAGSANIGSKCAMFEAIHGSAPDIAGQNRANPSGLIQAALMMLHHIGQTQVAARIENAWLKTIEDGLHTADIYSPSKSVALVGTQDFAKSVIERLGQTPQQLEARSLSQPTQKAVSSKSEITSASVSLASGRPHSSPNGLDHIELPSVTQGNRKELVGVDVFVHERDRDPNVLAGLIQQCDLGQFQLKMITNRGQKVWPNGHPETFCTDHWRCRFVAKNPSPLEPRQVIELLRQLNTGGVEFIKTENLYHFDGQPGFSMGQGE